MEEAPDKIQLGYCTLKILSNFISKERIFLNLLSELDWIPSD